MSIYSNIDQIGKVPNCCFGGCIFLYNKMPWCLLEIGIVRPSCNHIGYGNTKVKVLGKSFSYLEGERSSAFEGKQHVRN